MRRSNQNLMAAALLAAQTMPQELLARGQRLVQKRPPDKAGIRDQAALDAAQAKRERKRQRFTKE